MLDENKKRTHNFSYPASSAAVVFGVHLSARAIFRLDRESPAVGPCDYFLLYGNIVICLLKRKRSLTQFAIARLEFN